MASIVLGGHFLNILNLEISNQYVMELIVFDPGTIDISINEIAATRFDSEFYDYFHTYKEQKKKFHNEVYS